MPLNYLQRHSFQGVSMGTWGYDFDENDTYHEIKELFIDLIKSGNSVSESTDIILGQHCNDEDYHIVVIALADCLWHINMLTPKIYNMLEEIQAKNTDSLYLRACDANDDIVNKRKVLLNRFLNRLKTSPSKNQIWDLSKKSFSKPIVKGTVFWYRCNRIYGCIVLDVQNNSYYLIAVSEELTHVPNRAEDVLSSQLYTMAWFTDLELLPSKRIHLIETIQIKDDFNGRAGLKIDELGNIKINNYGQGYIWKHNDRNIYMKNTLMKDILEKKSLPLFHSDYI